MNFTNAVNIMKLKTDFTPEELKSAYRRLAVQTHPDKGGNVKTFVSVKAAYEFLLKSGPRKVETKPKPNYQCWTGTSSWGSSVTIEEVLFRRTTTVRQPAYWDMELVAYLTKMIVAYTETSKSPVNMITLAGDVLMSIKRQAAINAGVEIGRVSNFKLKGYNEDQILECLMKIIQNSL
jgi:hypothetical protein